MTNWKSNVAFFAFLIAYIYAVYEIESVDMVEATGFLAIISTLAMMIRSEDLVLIVKDLAQGFKERIKGK